MKRIKTFILDHFEGALIILIFIGIVAITFLVYYKFSFLNFFFLPVILAGYYLGKKKAVLTGIFCVLLVILFQVFFNLFSGQKAQLAFDDLINILTWGCFLIITAAIIGAVSEQRESKIKDMRKAYIGVLDIMLKYLEVADDEKPRSLRISHLAGKIAKATGLSTAEVENIKSAALLYEAGDLRSSISLFEEVADFMKSDVKIFETKLADKEQVMLKTTASLLKEAGPILASYFRYYVKEADKVDKDLREVPIGSSIIAVADLYDKISTQVQPRLGNEEVESLKNIEKLAGRTFPASIIQALREAILNS